MGSDAFHHQFVTGRLLYLRCQLNDWQLYPNGSRQTEGICRIHVLCSFNGNGAYAAFISSIDAPWESLMWVGGIPPLAAAFAMVFVLPSDKTSSLTAKKIPRLIQGKTHLRKKALEVKCSANLIGSLPSPVCF